MLTFATFFYGVLASFVMASISRNKREQRQHPQILTLFGWGMMSFSGVLAVLLLAYAGLSVAGVSIA